MMTNHIFQVGLILYGGIVCSYITWISIKQSAKERFSHLGWGAQRGGCDVRMPWPVSYIDWCRKHDSNALLPFEPPKRVLAKAIRCF